MPKPSRRTFLLGTAGAAVATSFATPAHAAPEAIDTIAGGLDIPWGLDFLPDGSALVTERDSARVLRVTPEGDVTRIGTVAGVRHGGEGGLLGLAVSPDFATDQRIYLYLSSEAGGDNRVGWATFDGTSLSAVTFIVTGIPYGGIHNGGSLEFSPASKRLFIGCGDSGNTSLPQNPRSLGGKVLRVDKAGRGTTPYAGRDSRIYTLGHRNPQGLAYYDRNGVVELWSAELGQNTWDELNRLDKSVNYGWPRSEGSDGSGGFRDPLVQWNPSECSPSGMTTLGRKAYVCGLRGGCLWTVNLHGADIGKKKRHFANTYGRLRNVKVAGDGTLWMMTSNGDDRDKIIQVRTGETP